MHRPTARSGSREAMGSPPGPAASGLANWSGAAGSVVPGQTVSQSASGRMSAPPSGPDRRATVMRSPAGRAPHDGRAHPIPDRPAPDPAVPARSASNRSTPDRSEPVRSRSRRSTPDRSAGVSTSRRRDPPLRSSRTPHGPPRRPVPSPCSAGPPRCPIHTTMIARTMPRPRTAIRLTISVRAGARTRQTLRPTSG